MKAVVVTGGRDFNNTRVIRQRLAELDPDLVIHGACQTGADRWAKQWAEQQHLPCLSFPARWDDEGKAAGPKRNRRMLDFACMLEEKEWKVLVLACPGGKGTANCVEQAKDLLLKVQKVEL